MALAEQSSRSSDWQVKNRNIIPMNRDQTVKWDDSWDVGQAVQAIQNNMMVGYNAMVRACEVFYKAEKLWKSKNVFPVLEAYRDKNGNTKEKTKNVSDYDRLLKALNCDPKVASRMSKVYESSATGHLEALCSVIEEQGKTMPSNYSVLYEIATTDKMYREDVRQLIENKQADTTVSDVRKIKNPTAERVTGTSFQPEKGAKVVCRVFSMPENYNANEAKINEAIKMLEGAGCMVDVRDYKNERKSEEARAKANKKKSLETQIGNQVQKNLKVKSFDNLSKSLREKIEKNGTGLTMEMAKKIFDKAIKDRTSQLEANKKRNEAREKEVARLAASSGPSLAQKLAS